jgi:DNA mismatch endonuclease, patch repair protein
MAAISSRDTAPEIRLRKALFASGIRGWRCHRKDLPGRPDIAFGRQRLAIFVDGAFWHGHPSKYWQGRSGPYWDAKIRRNQERDKAVDETLREMNWKVVRVWDFDVDKRLEEVVKRVLVVLEATNNALEEA